MGYPKVPPPLLVIPSCEQEVLPPAIILCFLQAGQHDAQGVITILKVVPCSGQDLLPLKQGIPVQQGKDFLGSTTCYMQEADGELIPAGPASQGGNGDWNSWAHLSKKVNLDLHLAVFSSCQKYGQKSGMLGGLLSSPLAGECELCM